MLLIEIDCKSSLNTRSFACELVVSHFIIFGFDFTLSPDVFSQGRQDVIDLMLQENDDVIRSEIDKEAVDTPPSLPYLAAAADHLECAKWYALKCSIIRSIFDYLLKFEDSLRLRDGEWYASVIKLLLFISFSAPDLVFLGW